MRDLLAAKTRRRFLTALLAFVTTFVLVGCSNQGDGDGNGGGYTGSAVEDPAAPAPPSSEPGTSPTPFPDLDSAVASVRDLFESTPAAIARDLSLWGRTTITSEQVDGFAHGLCRNGFNAELTKDFLRSEVGVKTLLLLGPAMRFLHLADTYCGRTLTSEKTAAYRQEMYRFLSDQPVAPPFARTIPQEGKSQICEFVGSKAGGDVVDYILKGLIHAATHGKVEPGDFLTFTVEVVGTYCDKFLQRSRQALQRYFSS